MTPRPRKFALAIATLALLVLALYFGNIAMYHYWAAGFHDAHFGWHELWGNRFSVFSLLLLASAAWAGVNITRRSVGKK